MYVNGKYDEMCEKKAVKAGVDVEAPVNEIIAILAKHGITIGLIDQVFERAKNRAINGTAVTTERNFFSPKKEGIETDYNIRILVTEKGKERLSKLVCSAIEKAYQQFYKEATCDKAGFVEIGPDA